DSSLGSNLYLLLDTFNRYPSPVKTESNVKYPNVPVRHVSTCPRASISVTTAPLIPAPVGDTTCPEIATWAAVGVRAIKSRPLTSLTSGDSVCSPGEKIFTPFDALTE